MDEKTLVRTRHALHGVAELLLAGPQYAAGNGIRLRPVAGGFATVKAPDVRVEGADLVTADVRLPIRGTYADLATKLGVQARPLDDVYAGGPEIVPDDPVDVEPEAAAQLADAFAAGAAALREFAPDQEPVLWPEHFDLGISVAGVNYGLSPGDDRIATPYVYVGPHKPREGDFWNEAFGAARLLQDLTNVAAVVTFFREGERLAGS